LDATNDMTPPEAPLEPPTSPLVQRPTQLRFLDSSESDVDEDVQAAFQPPVVAQPDATHRHFLDTSADDESQEATPAPPIALPPVPPIALPLVPPIPSQPDGEIYLSIAARDLCKQFAPARTKSRQLDPPLNWRISVPKVEHGVGSPKSSNKKRKKMDKAHTS
jgi:hypothetical protein